MQIKIKVGIGLMALGVAVWAAWTGWTRTRNVAPVDMAIRAADGQNLTKSFKLNYDGLYLIEIEAQKPEAAQALAEVQAEWNVSRGGREVNQGTTSEAHSTPGKSTGMTKVLGEFNGRAGEDYNLRVGFIRDTRELLRAKPRLKVVVSGLAKENLDAASVLLLSIVFICELFGLILVGIGIWAKTQRTSGDMAR